MKLLILLCAQSWNIFLVNSFEQLVKPGHTRAWSSSVAYIFDGYPRKTVDGDFRQNDYTYCMHTAGYEPEAWLRIDLRKIYNINSVKFWYRNDSRKPGYNTRRIQGFNIRLSNTTQTNHQDICYQDDGNKTLPPIIEKECEGVAQYVWIYTNKTFYGEAFLEICEVQIFGCSYQDSDGICISCDQCKNDCNINGECDDQGCKKDGYRLPFCKECKPGSYGDGCNSICGHCAGNVTCDHVTGSCPNRGCASGWDNTNDWRCDKECKRGNYGDGCNSTCGYCASNVTCDHVTGSCPNRRCEPGWENTKDWKCNKKCRKGFYGKHCSVPCGHCDKNATCDQVNGVCPFGRCEPGWKHTEKRRCDEECDSGTFGRYCRTACSGHCAEGLSCNKADGVCLGGCADGWRNPNCNETCKPGWYGRWCQGQCGHCSGNKTCHHVNGACPTLCQPGYQQGKCDEPCTNGWYGRECKEPCGYCRGNEPCHNVNGSCFGLCEPGYSGEKCVFSHHLANQREMIKLMRELLVYKRRKVELKENLTSPTDFR